jgi:peptide/nickel transport system permease protein
MAGFATFVFRRGINALVTILLMVLIIFLLINIVAPTPIAKAKLYAPNPRAPIQVLQEIAATHGFYDPPWVQFYDYIKNIFTGNFGTDIITGNPEMYQIEVYLPISLQIVIIGNVVGVLIGLFTGTISASNRNTKTDYAIKGIYLVTWSAPTFIVGALLQLIVAYDLGLLPSNSIVDSSLLASAPQALTGFPLVDSAIAGNWVYFVSVVRHMVLPVIAISLVGFGIITRLTRASMVDALDKDYVKLAYMKGRTKRQVVYGTALRNALIPIITIVAITIGFSFGGAVIIEDIFNYHGVGFFTVQAVYGLDYVAILALTIVLGIAVIASNFVADILYGVVDPRVRIE